MDLIRLFDDKRDNRKTAVTISEKPSPAKPPIAVSGPKELARAREPDPLPVVYHAKPFLIRSIDHQVTFEGVCYLVCAFEFNWLYSGDLTFAKVTIELPRNWSVTSRNTLGLTYKGRSIDCVDEMIGAFAQKGLMVSRRLVDACLFPITNQILEIERQLKSFQ